MVRAENPQFSDSSQRIMSVVLSDGLAVSDGVPVYPIATRWYLPLGELAEGLGLAIGVTPKLGLAEGFVFEETRLFKLDVAGCKVESHKVLFEFTCNEAVTYDDDVYVSKELLEKSLGLKIEIDSLRSEIVITSGEKFPIQLRQERARRSEKPLGANQTYDPGYERIVIPRENLDGVMVDQQLGFIAERNPTRNTQVLSHDTVVAGEILGFEASAFVSGTANSIERQRYSLARRSTESDLLGAMRASEVQLLDVTIPSLPLIGGGGLLRGAAISNYPLGQSAQFGQKDFAGDLPSGWEVELYQNDILLARQISNSNRYEFKKVQLEYGVNRFKLIFYGPQGQRREVYENYSIASTLTRPGSQNYRLAFGETISDGHQLFMQFDKSLLDNLSLVTAVARLRPGKQQAYENYGLLGLRSFLKNAFVSSIAVFNENGGYAIESGVLAPLASATVGASHTHLSNFFSQLYPIDRGAVPVDVFKANLAFTAFAQPAVRFTLEGESAHFEDQSSRVTLTQRTSTKTGPVYWFNNLTFENSESMAGELSSLLVIYGAETRTTLGYSNKSAESLSLEIQKPVGEKWSIGGGWQKVFRDKLERITTSLNREFRLFTLSANGSLDNLGDFSIGALFSYSFGREPRSSNWSMAPQPRALSGAASVLVYLDRDLNGVLSEGDQPLEGVEITVNQQTVGKATNASGITLISGLVPYEAADLTVSLKSLLDPLYRPSSPGVRFFPTPGKVARLEIPVIIASEVTGFVRFQKGRELKGKRAIQVLLVDAKSGQSVATVKTEADGYYLLESLRPGSYRLLLDEGQLRAQGLVSKPKHHDIEIGQDGLLDGVHDFSLYTNPDEGRD